LFLNSFATLTNIQAMGGIDKFTQKLLISKAKENLSACVAHMMDSCA
jgi:hypothetical protein